jgi:hypothetical protein
LLTIALDGLLFFPFIKKRTFSYFPLVTFKAIQGIARVFCFRKSNDSRVFFDDLPFQSVQICQTPFQSCLLKRTECSVRSKPGNKKKSKNQCAHTKHVSLFHDFFKISRLKKKKFPDFGSRKISRKN